MKEFFVQCIQWGIEAQIHIQPDGDVEFRLVCNGRYREFRLTREFLCNVDDETLHITFDNELNKLLNPKNETH